MTHEQIARMLKETGFPVAYGYFPEESPPESVPYIAYSIQEEDGFCADNELYACMTATIVVELCTAKKDIVAEYKLIEAFKRHNIIWGKSGESWTEKHIFSSYYEFEEVICHGQQG